MYERCKPSAMVEGASFSLMYSCVCCGREGDSESVLIFNCGSDKDAAELCVPLSSLPFSSLLICPADVARAHTTLPPSPADAVRAYLKHRAERGAVCPPYEPVRGSALYHYRTNPVIVYRRKPILC